MFKNAIVYRIVTMPEFIQHEPLNAHTFAECGATQQKSIGWVPPRGHDHGDIIEAIGGEMVLRLRTETKSVPTKVIEKHVDEKSDAIEAATGRRPGRRERKDLKEEALLALLPAAFPKQSDTTAIILPALSMLVIDASSAARAEDVATLLVKCIEGFSVAPIQTNLSPAVAMGQWLLEGEAPNLFGVGRECLLKAPDETKAAVRYANHTLDIEQVRDHIRAGKVASALRLCWNGRVDFTMTDTLQLKKIRLDDVVFESGKKGAVDEAFDADVAILTGELSLLLPQLIEALDGEMESTATTETKE